MHGRFEKGNIPWNKDKPLTKEHKDKISKKLMGIKHSPETKIKMGKAKEGQTPWKDKFHSIESKQKMSIIAI